MSDEVAFLDRIRAAPGDRTVRLVYADWLEERGQTEKAILFRTAVGCELAIDVDGWQKAMRVLMSKYRVRPDRIAVTWEFLVALGRHTAERSDLLGVDLTNGGDLMFRRIPVVCEET